MAKVFYPGTWSLYDIETPQPPDSVRWADVLRWLVCVMDPDDKSLSYVASCLSHALQFNGLSDKQHIVCAKISDRVRASYDAGTLLCQNLRFFAEDDNTASIADMQTEGSA